MSVFNLCWFWTITGHSLLENRDLKYNSTVHKKPQTVIYFPQKSIIFTFLSICVLKIFYQHNFHNLFYIQIPLNIVFSSFSTHKLYNLQKITLTPYKVNQIEKTQKGIIININLVKLILFATYLIGFSGNKGSLKLFPYDISSVKLDILSVQHPKSKWPKSVKCNAFNSSHKNSHPLLWSNPELHYNDFLLLFKISNWI